MSLSDVAIRRAHYLEGYKAGAVREYVNFLLSARNDVIGQLSAGGELTAFKRDRLEKLLASIDARVDKAYTQASAGLLKNLSDLAELESEFEAESLSDVLPARLNVTVPSGTQVAAAVFARPFQNKLLKDYANGLGKAKAAEIANSIRSGYFEGLTNAEIVRRLTDNEFAGSVRQAEAVVRTAIGHTANAARNAVWQANADIVAGVEWVSALDSRTTAVCRGRDGQVYPVDSGPRPPGHWNCRSTTVAVLKDDPDQNSGTRASADGPVAGDLNYSGWLKTQPKAFVVDILGKDKAELFLKGGLPLSKFIDKAGNELTLPQLKAKYKAAWGKTFGKPAQGKKPPVAPTSKKAGAFNKNEAASLDYVVTNGEKGNREYASLLLSDGSELLRRKGDKHSVSFNSLELAQMKGGRLYHNHPGGASLSPADLGILVEFELDEMVAIGNSNRTIYRARLPAKTMETAEKRQAVASGIRQVWTPAYNDLSSFLLKNADTWRGKLTADEAHILATHAANVVVSDAGFFRYSVERLPTAVAEYMKRPEWVSLMADLTDKAKWISSWNQP